MSGLSSFSTMRQLLQGRSTAEQCNLCGNLLPRHHEHLIDPEIREITCVCRACALLFSSQGKTKYRRIQQRLRYLADFRLTDVQWANLGLPINLAFFFTSSTENRIMAFYPSPGGAIESLLDLEAWREIARENPVLSGMQPDIEALLVNRLGSPAHHFLAPIDQCYKLVGLIRTHWRGLSGGRRVWEEIETFFADLAGRADRQKEDSLA